MRNGTITTVIFANDIEAQLEICAVGSLDGTPLTEILGVAEGECGKRIALQPGWHVIEGNVNPVIAGFGVRWTASGWATMTESDIIWYTSCWNISGDAATWTCGDDKPILMTPSMIDMMQNFGVLKHITWSTSNDGQILMCNGDITGSENIPTDGSCRLHNVGPGTYTYNGDKRLSAGSGWYPVNK